MFIAFDILLSMLSSISTLIFDKHTNHTKIDCIFDILTSNQTFMNSNQKSCTKNVHSYHCDVRRPGLQHRLNFQSLISTRRTTPKCNLFFECYINITGASSN